MTISFNECLPAFDSDVHGNTGLQSIKKGMVVEVFFIYLIYLVVIVSGTLKEKYKDNEIKKPSTNITETTDQRLFDRLDYHLFDRFFYPYYGFHTICVGTVLLYSPYSFSIIIVWIHFLLFIIMLGLKVKFGEEKNRLLFFIYALCQFLNIILIFSALVSLGGEKSCP